MNFNPRKFDPFAPNQPAQEEYALFEKVVTLKVDVNGIPAGTVGVITQVRPGFLGSPWRYAFMADDWEQSRHPFTLITGDQFKLGEGL